MGNKGFRTSIEYTFEDVEEGYDVLCNIEVTYHHCPGRTSGLPEDCYPDESEAFAELEDIESIFYEGDLVDPPESIYKKFTDRVTSLMEEDEHFEALFEKAEKEAYTY